MASNINTTGGAFINSTFIVDVNELYQLNVDPGMRELLVRLALLSNNIALLLNQKDTGTYTNDQQFVCGQSFFPNPTLSSSTSTTPTFRQVYRIVVNFGTLPNNTTKSVPHNIPVTPATTFTRIYGTASDTVGKHYIGINYGTDVLIDVDATNVTITTTSDRTAFTVTYVILEYLQS